MIRDAAIGQISEEAIPSSGAKNHKTTRVSGPMIYVS